MSSWKGMGRVTKSQKFAGGARLAKYLSLPAIVGNYASTPDAPANRITGSLDLRVLVGVADWGSVGDFTVFIAKDTNADPNKSYAFYLDLGTGLFSFHRSLLGVLNAAISTVPPNFAANQIAGARVTHNVDTGEILFYTSLDGGQTWIQLGAPRGITAGVGDAGIAALTLGTVEGGIFYMKKQNILWAEVRTPIDGPVVARFDSTRGLQFAATITAETGELWTINRAGTGHIAHLF